MQIARDKHELQAHIAALRQQGKRIALIPTMGALHAGHLSLIDIGKQHADCTIVSIFVNPTQFGQEEDLDTYPRQEAEDLKILEHYAVDNVYTPNAKDIYPDGPTIDVKTPNLANVLCGISRPVFFDGVATVVKRLFEHVEPDIAVFGEKDYQQLLIIQWLVKNYDIPVDIIAGPIIREDDGLAMASRNAYLSKEERVLAPEIYKTLTSLQTKAEQSRKRSPQSLMLFRDDDLEDAKSHLIDLGFSIDYLEVRDAHTLEPTTAPPARIFIAAHLSNTRLIDNIALF